MTWRHQASRQSTAATPPRHAPPAIRKTPASDESYKRKPGRPQITNPKPAPNKLPMANRIQNPNQSLGGFDRFNCNAFRSSRPATAVHHKLYRNQRRRPGRSWSAPRACRPKNSTGGRVVSCWLLGTEASARFTPPQVTAPTAAGARPILWRVHVRQLRAPARGQAQATRSECPSQCVQRELLQFHLVAHHGQHLSPQQKRESDVSAAAHKQRGVLHLEFTQNCTQQLRSDKRHIASKEKDRFRFCAGERSVNTAQWPAARHRIAADHPHRQTELSGFRTDLPQQSAFSQPEARLVPAHAPAESARKDADFKNWQRNRFHSKTTAVALLSGTGPWPRP